MALTVTYSFDQEFPKTVVPTFGSEPGSDSDTVGFSNGGWATSAVDTGGFSDLTFYNAAGTVLVTDVGFRAVHSSLAQLTNGNVVAVGTPGAGGVDFHIDTSTGGFVGSGSIAATTTETNADVAALAGGGFVVFDQRAFASPDHDIEIHVRDATGGVVTDFYVSRSADDDENASVAGLNDGGFAVAFERIDSSGNSTAWLAVYNADGSTRLGPTEFDGAGSINHHMNVTALQWGGFSVGYEDNGWANGNDITVGIFDQNGGAVNFSHTSELTTDDSEAAVTTLSNGFVVSTFTNNHGNGGDLDILATLIEPANAGSLTSSTDPLHIDFSADVTSDSSVSALGHARFAVSYTNATTSAVDVATFQLVRHVTGTSGADSFTGDAAVNIVIGLDGSDILTGGSNADIINGDKGADRINGRAGNDKLTGGLGADRLTGGDGADTFIFNSTAQSNMSGSGRDTILDFSHAEHDKIDLRQIDARTAVAGNQAFHFIGTAAFTHHSGELRYTTVNGNVHIHGDVNGDGRTDFSVQVNHLSSILASDFHL